MKVDIIQNYIVNWITKYASKHQKNTLVVGVSGGIDSALTSTLCSITGIKTIAISIPIHQKKIELENTQRHTEWLSQNYSNTEILSLDLSNTFDSFKSSIPNKYQSELGLANSKSRIRMTTLYQIATQANGIVVGTGNKIEDFGIGFFTKYGDGGVDISPIADLKKSEVKKLAIFSGVVKDIINTPPTDGLWEDGRSDEDQIGATYTELEWAMDFKENRRLNNREKEVLRIYKHFNAQTKHKTLPIPICKIPKKFR